MTDRHEPYHFDTLAIRTGHQRTAEGEHGEPIFPTSSFVFNSAAEAAARFSGEQPGNIYARFTNPTVRNFEQRLAALEGGESCVATASGMAAILSVCLGLLKAGDHIVSSRSIFGTTSILFERYMGKFGVETKFVDLTDLSAWEQAIQQNTQLLFLETPSNPLTEVADIRALADLAHAKNCLLVVDNCFCTPALQQPLKLMTGTNGQSVKMKFKFIIYHGDLPYNLSLTREGERQTEWSFVEVELPLFSNFY